MEGHPKLGFYLKFLKLGGVEGHPTPREFYSLWQTKVLKVLEKIVPNVIKNRSFDEDGARAD